MVSSTIAPFNLARVDTPAGASGGIHDLSIDGSLLNQVGAGAQAFFGLGSAQGGVVLPADNLGSVGMRDNGPAGSILAAGIQAVSFGSVTEGSTVVPGSQATAQDAQALLAPTTPIVLAAGSFLAPFDAQQTAAFFFATKANGHFDSSNVLFTDERADGFSVHATIGVASSVIQTIALQGNGGAIATSQPIQQSITSTGALGDLILSASGGLGANVTAPSIFGNIMISSGSLNGTIQTTVGDIGLVTPGPNGTFTTTEIDASGITGSIISRGNVVSQVNSNGQFNGLLAAQGNLGAIETTSTGGVVRVGGFHSSGAFTGFLVTLGQILGDMTFNAGLHGGRVAAEGGILGNVTLNVGLDSQSAFVSGGAIGSAAFGTSMTVNGSNKGIIAAVGPITFGKNPPGGFVFNNVGPNSINGQAIDAIFTNGGIQLEFDINPGDLKGLALILTDLANLFVNANGQLGGTIP
jgi:hypothetical protein